MLDRALGDRVDVINFHNCNSITQSFMEAGRCRCSIGPWSSIVSTNTGQIECVKDNNIDRSKYS